MAGLSSSPELIESCHLSSSDLHQKREASPMGGRRRFFLPCWPPLIRSVFGESCYPVLLAALIRLATQARSSRIACLLTPWLGAHEIPPRAADTLARCSGESFPPVAC